jgi:microcystin-dependent protein
MAVDYILTPNMNLTVPIVGVTLGPDWASEVDACLVVLDGHDHSAGKGVFITPSGLNINADLPFGGNNANTVRTVRFSNPNAQPTGASDVNCVYAYQGNLYYNNGSFPVQVTNGHSISGTPGSIANLTSPASATYVSLSSTFVWQSDSNTPANMDAASYILRNLAANSKGLTLSPPSAMAADYTITLPALPASGTSLVTLSSSGAMGTVAPDGNTIINTGTTLEVGPGSISNTQVVGGFGLIPTGAITQFAGSAAPNGYLLCDGTSYTRTAQAGLFAVIGTAYGAADSTHFNVPDMRGFFPRGAVPSGLNAISGSGTVTSNQATFTAHAVNRTGFMVRLASGTLSGLSAGITYFAILIDANTLSFATTLANALAGTAIAITGANSGVLQQWEDPDAASRTALTVGGATGSSLGSQQSDQVGPLSLSMSGGAVGGGTTGNPQHVVQSDSAGLTMNTNSNGTTETRPINLYFNFIIKT